MESNYFVYKHTSPSGKVYIGITKQAVKNRWKNGLGYASSPHFWNAIQKYGWDNFKHEVLFANLTCEEACLKEKELIEFYKSVDRHFGYNEKTGGEAGTTYNEHARRKISESLKAYYAAHPEKVAEIAARVTGFKHSEESKAKMSESKKGIIFTETPEWRRRIGEANRRRMQTDQELYERNANRLRELGKQNSVPVVQIDLDGNDVARFDSATEAQRITGARNCNIIMCCQGKRKTANGYKWRFADDYNCARESA